MSRGFDKVSSSRDDLFLIYINKTKTISYTAVAESSVSLKIYSSAVCRVFVTGYRLPPLIGWWWWWGFSQICWLQNLGYQLTQYRCATVRIHTHPHTHRHVSARHCFLLFHAVFYVDHTSSLFWFQGRRYDDGRHAKIWGVNRWLQKFYICARQTV